MVSGEGTSYERLEKDNIQIVQDNWNNGITEKNNEGSSSGLVGEGNDLIDFTANFK